MLPEAFDLISRRSPLLRQCLWRAWYEYLAHACRDADWRFMNFGYRDLDPDSRLLVLSASDEHDRLPIQLYHHLLSSVNLRDHDVLEVGCGRGGGCSYISRYFPTRSVTGIDLSRKAIALCRRHHTGPGLSFHRGRAESMPFADAAFDVVINVESSHCYASIERAVGEVNRVLRSGGHFLFADLRSAEDIGLLRQRLRASKLRLVKEALITANVLAALDDDHERKRALIPQKIPRLFRAQFQQFAGLKSTAIYEAIRNRRAEYLSCVLQKTAD